MVQKISGSGPMFGCSVEQIEPQSTKQTDGTTGNCDAFNTCIGGINMFNSFIGLEEDTD